MSIDNIEDLKKDIKKLTDKIKQERDELNLKLHLAKAEARDEWKKAEENWEHFRAKSVLRCFSMELSPKV